MESNNTNKSFKEKWENNPALVFEQTLNESSEIFKWITQRNGFASSQDFRNYLQGKKKILDAGCGNGRVTALLQKYADLDAAIMGIDLNADKVASSNLKNLTNVRVENANLLEDLKHLGNFDFVYCQEVLHHTGQPEKGFENLVNLLDKDGEIAIYVYKQKAPVREFVDDFVKEKIANMNYEEAMQVSSQITTLGKQLADLKVMIDVPEIGVLGIEQGQYDLQRFFYHFFMKCFWNDEHSFEENAVINYDWYHPEHCSRHTIEEILQWFANNNLQIVHQFVDFYGITVRGKKI
jgi:2-polyprenyl-3-methyl-5-hydroxy-6-metoxy-1,4-benzoquinol methylase